jgi:lipid-A-disaccharide synthase
MKYFIVAGEPSGDLHGANLMKALKQKDPQAQFTFMGGDLMLKEGGELIIHYRQMAFMGGVEVLKNLRTIFRNMGICKKAMLLAHPDVVILIDYAGFNLKMARFAKLAGLRTFFYISPKVWAWRENRVKKIKAYIDKMFVILPFETEFYRKHDYTVYYVGNPLLDAIRNFEQTYNETLFHEKATLPEKYIALLPGSRAQEVTLLLNEMIACARHFHGQYFVLAAAPSLPPAFYEQFELPQNVKIVYDKTYHVLKGAYAAIVTSGTATLETALFGVPQVVVYKTNALQYYVGRMVVPLHKFKYFSLVNLILQKPAVKEILQFDVAPKIIAELERILHQPVHREMILNDYDRLNDLMGQLRPSEKLAEYIVGFLNE